MPWECKNISCQKASGFFPSDFEFSFSAKFRDLLTSDDVISVLICISSVAFYSVLQYKHFEVWLVVLWFRVLEITTIFLSPTPKLSPRLNSKRRTLWRHFWSYCRVTKSLPSLFCYATWSSSWKWRETSRTFFCTRGPPQRLDYSARRYISVMSRVLLASLMSSKMPNDAGYFGKRELTCTKRYTVQMRKTFQMHTRVAKRESL